MSAKNQFKKMLKTLATLKSGESAQISENQSSDIPVELIEIGFLPGSYVQVMQIAPLNDPMHVRLSGGYFSIRKETAKSISINEKD